MWKKSEPETPDFELPRSVTTQPQPVGEKSVIGPSLMIKGTLAGDEDLVIQGEVDGKIELRSNSVTVGKQGRVKADIFGRIISVEGDVQGNLFGEEKIVVGQTGNVRGNIMAPRVTLQDGARFKGTIDMDGSVPKQPGLGSLGSGVANERRAAPIREAEKETRETKGDSAAGSLALKVTPPASGK